MAIEKSSAIVLRTWKYGDTSRIASLYTRRFGKIRMIARGARGRKPRFGASLEPFTESLVVFYRKPDRELQLLSSSDSIESFTRTRQRPVHLGLACALVESIERMTEPEHEDGSLYELLRDALAAIEASLTPAAAESEFWAAQKRLLDHLGYRWELDRCVSCGAPVSGVRVAFDPLQGVACADCDRSLGGCLVISAKTRDALAAELSAPLSGETLTEIRRVFASFYERCGFGRGPLRSLGYLSVLAADETAVSPKPGE